MHEYIYLLSYTKMASNNALTFKVTRQNPELIPPAKPTPHEFKPLSDIDDQDGLRFQVPGIQFYRRNPSREGKDPVKVIRDAIAKALVFYYPLAGRLREFAARKLVVECTGEGVLFVEAHADVTLQQFGHPLHPPFPCLDDLLYDVPGSAGLIDCPLLLFQVTRLKCGGFIIAYRLNHTTCDGVGIHQFLSAVAELARGADSPSVLPVWQRHLLSARSPPHVSCTHHQYDVVTDSTSLLVPLDDMVQRNFFFGNADIAALRRSLPLHLRHCSKVELLAACIWRCRTIAIAPKPNEEVRFLCVVNIRKRFDPPLPEGYYGNAVVAPAAITTAENLSKHPLHYAVELIRKAKSEATEEYVKSVADLLVIRGRLPYTLVRTYVVSDLMHAGFDELDFGWGKAAYGGPTEGGVDLVPGLFSFLIPIKNNKGQDEILVSLNLPSNAMEVFVKELEVMMETARKTSILNASAL